MSQALILSITARIFADSCCWSVLTPGEPATPCRWKSTSLTSEKASCPGSIGKSPVFPIVGYPSPAYKDFPRNSLAPPEKPPPPINKHTHIPHPHLIIS